MPDSFFLIDLPALIIVTLASISCALLGSFLVIKRQAVLIDAISHSVLPGIVMGVLLSGSFSIIYVMGGALVATIIAVLLVQLLTSIAKIEQGAAIGATFTTMFALGVFLLETQIGSKIHLDTEHVLYGALELSFWPTPYGWDTIPTQIITLSILLCALIAMLFLFFKEIRMNTFDPLFGRMIGHKPVAINILLLFMTTLVAVSSFEAMGSILVIALFVCPAAAARLITNTLQKQLLLSAGIAMVCAVSGYVCSALVPLWFDIGISVNSASVIAIFAGLSVLIAFVTSRLSSFRGIFS